MQFFSNCPRPRVGTTTDTLGKSSFVSTNPKFSTPCERPIRTQKVLQSSPGRGKHSLRFQCYKLPDESHKCGGAAQDVIPSAVPTVLCKSVRSLQPTMLVPTERAPSNDRDCFLTYVFGWESREPLFRRGSKGDLFPAAMQAARQCAQ